MLNVAELECVRGDRRLFNGMNFSLEAGAMLQVQGPNGSGKTSLLRMLCGLMAPAHGEIRWKGERIRSLGEEYFKYLTYIGHFSAIKDELTAQENLRISAELAGVDVDLEAARDALARMGLAGREHLPAKVLSQGQRRRVALSRLLVCDTPLWILDEPLTALDKQAVGLIQSLLGEHLRRGGMVVLTTHQELDVTAVSPQRIEL